jgi:hypothetical protein
MPAAPLLRTVSEKPEGGGKYRTIKDALVDIKSWTTIRVLDTATYPEHIVLNDANRHTGLTLEAVKGAVLSLSGDNTRSITITDVPDVRLRGFRFREDAGKQGSCFLVVTGRCAGVTLEDLDLRASDRLDGIHISDSICVSDQRPVCVRRCLLQGFYDAMVVDGGKEVRIEDNRISTARYKGIKLVGHQSHVHLTGNAVWRCGQGAVQLEDVRPGTTNVLIANNTLLDSAFLFRVWDNPPHKEIEKGAVQVRSNIAAGAQDADFTYMLGNERGDPVTKVSGDQVFSHWLFRDNLRDRSGSTYRLETAPGDQVDRKGASVGRDPGAADFLQPLESVLLVPKEFPQDAPQLPPYIGAVAPKGTKSWDWDVTWRSRTRKTP